MTDLVDRYVHQVGQNLPAKVRADIQAELRSQIHDQLEDRFGESPSQADVVAVLNELGDPRRMAASYREEQYLVGPALYPTMMAVLRYGWLIILPIVIFLGIFGGVTATEPSPLVDVILETALAALQAGIIFSSVVVLIFALIERVGLEEYEKSAAFNPLELPQVDDPGSVNRFEAGFEIAVGTIVELVLFYFLAVGGFTLRFNLSDPGEVILVPVLWIVLLIAIGIALIGLQFIAIWRSRWSTGLWLLSTVLELFGIICSYFVLYKPFIERITETIPPLADLPFMSQLPAIIAVVYAVMTLISRGDQFIKMLNYSSTSAAPLATRTDQQRDLRSR